VVKIVVIVGDVDLLTSLSEFNNHGLWGITMSLIVVAATLFL